MMQYAVIFPGQGSQQLGMCGDLAEQFPLVRDLFHEASELLGYDLWVLTQQGPQEQLNQTEFTQPALLTASIATWQCWQLQNDLAPRYFAGHSLGEYSALVAAQSITFADAVRLVASRGRFMQQAVGADEGAMAAILGLTDDEVRAVCDQAAQGAVLSPANYNSIGQVVIAGQAEAVDRAIELAKQAGAKIAKRIPVSVPSHCELMRPAAEQLAEQLAQVTIHSPKVPVIHNVDVLPHQQADEIRMALQQQLYGSVRWVETIQWFAQQGVQQLVECGPGRVLTGLVKRIDKTMNCYPLTDSSDLNQVASSIEGEANVTHK